MERVGEIIKHQPQAGESLVSKSNAIVTTSEAFSAVELLRHAGAPEWEIEMFKLAQGKRHDLPSETVDRWREKLSPYKNDAEIKDAILLYAGEFFPDVQDIVEIIERRRSHAANNKPWDKFKTERREAEAKGLLASTDDYEWLRSQFKKVAEQVKPVGEDGNGKSGQTVEAVRQSGDTRPDTVAEAHGSQ